MPQSRFAPRYRINRDMLYQLEHYLFTLSRFVDTVEFKEDMKSDKQRAILHEIGYISICIDVIRNAFHGGNNEIPVVGWERDNPDETDYFKVYYFSCNKVASLCTGVTPTKITQICKGHRKASGGKWILNEETGRKEYRGGWTFKYRDDYEENDVPGLITPSGPMFDIINY